MLNVVDSYTVENAQVLEARTRITGHFHLIELQLCFNCCMICINPKRNWFSDDGEMPFYKLFDCFDIDCENGANFEQLSGKYCRLLTDDSDHVVGIAHIIDDKRYVLIEDLH